MDTRLDRERAFHNRGFGSESSRPADRFYAVCGRGFAFYESLITTLAENKRVLEYGCGPGSYAFALADWGAEVTGIDISDVGVRMAEAHARDLGVEHRTTFRVMDAEALEFPEETFDLVCGTGILHHLDLGRAFSEIARTLRPDGTAVFLEPLGHNPLINLYRSMTPEQRTPDEHPLVLSDLRHAGRYFASVETHYFHLLSLLAMPMATRRGFAGTLAWLDGLDARLFRRVRRSRHFAWMVALVLANPYGGAAPTSTL